MIMATCPKCGAEIKEEDKFCPSCGTPLTAKADKPIEKESYPREREGCFGEGERHRDYSGLVSFGILLLVVGVVFLANTNIVSDFRLWVEQSTTQETLLRPPQGLIDSAALFFGLMGVSNFFMAGVRFMADRVMRRILADVISGVALVLFAYLIYLYGVDALAWPMVLAIEAVTCGVLIIAYSVVRYLFPKRFH
jgi:hypothetical protein